MMCSDIVHPLAAGPVSARFLRNERHVLPESLVTGGVYDCALMPVSFSIVSRSVRCSMEKALCPEATADTAAELGCGISPHMSFRSARLRIGVMLRSLRCRDHAVTWCAGRESCRSLDGSRTAQTDQSRSFCSRNHKNCCLADEPLKKQKSSRNVRRALLRLSPYRVGKNPDKKKKTQAGSRNYSRRSRLCPFDFLALFSFPQNCGRWGDWQFSSLPKQLILQKRLEGLFKEQGRT